MESEKAKAKAGKLYDANNDIELVSECVAGSDDW